ncbi:MAG: hypothetical protein K8S87_10850 [Planctomycetes bacterium]|nr:hypothetical protein [Planctomycetota bacterium]
MKIFEFCGKLNRNMGLTQDKTQDVEYVLVNSAMGCCEESDDAEKKLLMKS